jgi:hypothetical protein
MKKLIGFLLLFLVFTASVFSEEDGLSNDDNPPGLQEYLKQLENQKKVIVDFTSIQMREKKR